MLWLVSYGYNLSGIGTYIDLLSFKAVKMFKDLTKEVPPIMHVLNIHENLLEALLEMGNYAGEW